MFARDVLWICLSYAVQMVLSESEDIQLGSKTCGRSFYLKEELKYQVKWDGRKLSSECRVEFINSKSDDFKLLVTTDEYEVTDCDFVLLYKYGGRIREEYRCHSYVDWKKLPKLRNFYMYFKATKRSSSKLEIEVSIFPDVEEKSYTGQLFLVVAIMIVICLCICAKKCGFNCGDFICNCPQQICSSFCESICDCNSNNDCNDCFTRCYYCDCKRRSTDRRTSVITHQPTPEPVTECTELPSRTSSVEISVSDSSDFYDALEETPPPSNGLLSITWPSDHERQPPSYEECVGTNRVPQALQTPV